METTRAGDAAPYEAPKHHGMTAYLLQGRGATGNEHFWLGMSHFEPGGGAEWSASPTEKVYFVLSGEVTIVTDDGTTVLRETDSCRIAPNEFRAIENRGAEVARMLVMSATQGPGANT